MDEQIQVKCDPVCCDYSADTRNESTIDNIRHLIQQYKFLTLF